MEKIVAIYTRVSSDEQSKEGHSLPAQKAKLEKFCEEKGWKIFKHYEDAGISGKNIKNRPAFVECLIDAEARRFSAILVTKLERPFRNTKEAILTSERLNKISVDLVSLSENIDTTTAMGRFFFVMTSALAQLERELTGERVGGILEKKFNDGFFVGKLPLGYKWSKTKKMVVIDEKEAKVVRDIFDKVSSGISYRVICDTYKIKPQVFYNLIRNKAYIGKINYKGKEKQGIHEPLISLELFNKVNGK